MRYVNGEMMGRDCMFGAFPFSRKMGLAGCMGDGYHPGWKN